MIIEDILELYGNILTELHMGKYNKNKNKNAIEIVNYVHGNK